MQLKIVGENFPIGVNVVDLVMIEMELNGEYKISKQEKASVIADLARHMKFNNVRFRVVVIGNMTTLPFGLPVRVSIPFVLEGKLKLRDPNGESLILAAVVMSLYVHHLLNRRLRPDIAQFLVVDGEITDLNPYVDTVKKDLDV